MKPSRLLELMTPPFLLAGCRALRAGKQRTDPPKEYLHLSGDYPDWAAAVADSTGYDDEAILQKTTAALLKVKRGEAVYERDSVLFDEVQYAWPLLAGLMWAAARAGGRLNVLDFGGSLGSTYFQNRAFLKGLHDVRWNVIEQPRHVQTGRKHFQDEQLKFYERTEDCLAETTPGVIVVSGVLQYLEDPYVTLHMLLSLPCDQLLVDRTPFWDGPADRLCVQHVPAEIYQASYPCRIFSRQQFRAALGQAWDIVAEFDSLDRFPSPVTTRWKGMSVVKRETHHAHE
jgi:putative methyltransferase (TIGR04325 family)